MNEIYEYKNFAIFIATHEKYPVQIRAWNKERQDCIIMTVKDAKKMVFRLNKIFKELQNER